uniref:hypothetical protein n=1 Tax=Paracoccus aminophilus TaxID=34003 RepID=UPI00159EF396|nr:hypothetical protein [Paracoccus aminophilus]
MKPTDFDRLAYEMCVKYGLCNPSLIHGEPRDLSNYIPATGNVTASQYIEGLLMVSGFDPVAQEDVFREWTEMYRSVFVKHMGKEVVDASLLRSSAKS